jgi:hypothetical protein
MTELILPSLYVESTRSINPQGCNYLSLDHSTHLLLVSNDKSVLAAEGLPRRGLTMVLGETEVNLVLASSTPAGIVNQSFFQIRRYTTLFSLAQRWSINLCYPLYEVLADMRPVIAYQWGNVSCSWESECDRDDCSKELISWGHYVAAANARAPAKI